MWTITTMLFYSAMQNSIKTWQRWQKVDKIKTVHKFKDYNVCSMCPPFAQTQALSLLRHWSTAILTVDCSGPHQSLLQFVDGVDFPLVYTTLRDITDLVINWIETWTVWRPQIWRKKSGVSRHRTSTVSHEHSQFTLVLVLQGNVATKLSYGGKFFIFVMSHFFQIPTQKEF